MEVIGQPHAPLALLLGKEPLMPIEKKAGWAPEPVWTFGRSEKSLTPAGIQTPNHPAHKLVIVLTMPSWLFVFRTYL
jgi:hypothetical protein